MGKEQGTYLMLILEGHNSHESVAFKEFCQENKIIPICFCLLTSHTSANRLMLSFLVYWSERTSRGISTFIRAYITQITKVKFFLALHAACRVSFTPKNMAERLRGAWISPFDPEVFIDKLDIKVRSIKPAAFPFFANAEPWVIPKKRHMARYCTCYFGE